MVIKVLDKTTGEWVEAKPVKMTKSRASRFAKLATSNESETVK